MLIATMLKSISSSSDQKRALLRIDSGATARLSVRGGLQNEKRNRFKNVITDNDGDDDDDDDDDDDEN